jgi:homeobox protein cut-like
MKRQMDRLKEDNVQLYEKIRYMESYRPNSVTKEAIVNIPQFRDVSRSTDETAAMKRYSNLYEEKLDPFQQFHKKVRIILGTEAPCFSEYEFHT